MHTTLAPSARTPRHAGRPEAWIDARAFINRNAGHKGRHGIYRATVARPHSPRESRVRHALRTIARYVGALPAPTARYGVMVGA